MKRNFFAGCAMFAAALFSFNGYAQRIAVLSDIHVTPGNENERMLKKAVREINSDRTIDMVVVDGDLTNEGSDEQLMNVKGILDSIIKPQFVLPGNHENTWSQSATKSFIDIWGNDRFVTETPDYVIVGTNCGPFMKMGDGHVKQEDLHWLRSTLKSRLEGSDKKVISFNHYPLRKDDLDNYEDYIALLEDFPTVIHINGHYHKYEPYKSGSINSMMVRALDNKKNHGYTIVDFKADSIYIYNKVVDSPAEKVHAYPVELPKKGMKHAVSEYKDRSLPGGYSLVKVHEDTASIFTRLGFSANKVFYGNSLGYLKALDKKDSKELWNIKTSASLFARPVVSGKLLFIPSADKRMIVADENSGRIVREYPSDGPYMADGVSDDGKVYIGGYKKFERYDGITGNKEWVFDSINNYCQASPRIYGDNVYFGAWDTYLRSLDKETGKMAWKWNNGRPANMLGPGNVVPVVSDSVVIVVAPDRYMTAVNRATGETLWRDNSVKYRESLGVSEDGKKAYAKTMDGELICVEVRGDRYNRLWITDMGIGYEHAPCIVAEKDGIVYAGSRRGIVTAVDADTHKVLWSERIGSSEINGIDIDPYSGDVYVSLIEGTVWKVTK